MTRRGKAQNDLPACVTRLNKDLVDVKKMNSVKLEIPDESNIFEFDVSIKVGEGLYRGKYIKFHFSISREWPNVAPDVRCVTKLWHPNIEVPEKGGQVCVSTLKGNYLPSTTIEQCIVSLQFLLCNPNPHDARNPDAANQQLQNYEAFKNTAEEYMDLIEDDDEDDDDED